MADKRIYSLSTASSLIGKYIIVDSSALTEAEKYLVTNLATVSDLEEIGVKVSESGITSTTTVSIPSGAKVVSIDARVTTASMTFKVGTSVGAEDVVTEETLAVGYDGNYIIFRTDLGGSTLHVTVSGSGSVEIVVFYQENWF